MKRAVLFFLGHLFWFLNIPIILIIVLAIFLPLVGLPGSRFFSLICHHLPNRSPPFGGTTIWLCYRCLAIWSTFLLGALAWQVAGSRSGISRRTIALALAFTFPLLIDGITQSSGWRTSQNWLRILTGSLMGFPWGWLVNQRLAWETSQILKRREENEKSTFHHPGFTGVGNVCVCGRLK